MTLVSVILEQPNKPIVVNPGQCCASAVTLASVMLEQPFKLIFVNPGQCCASAVTLVSVMLEQSHKLIAVSPGQCCASAVLGFAHTIGEFGIVLMIGGNIPGETRVLSILLFDQVEALNYASAHLTAGILLLISLITLTFTYAYLRRES